MKMTDTEFNYLGRCCLCPNQSERKTEQSRTCPGRKNSPHPESSTCRFVVSYLDDNGYTVFVSSGLWNNGKTFMSFRIKTKSGSMHRIKTKFLPERKSFDEAQKDLNKYAKEKGWRVNN